MQTVARKGKLVLKDGSVYEGELYGKRNAVGEVVFTTGMSGYQETLTDPSFCGQIVVMTYPLVGNYGTNDLFNQGRKSFFQGYVISELCDHPSNWRCEKTLEQFLDEQDVPVLTGVDTRAITRKLRNYGVLQGVIVPAEMPQEEVEKLLATPEVHDQVATVTAEEILAAQPDGIFLANGPGDPKDLQPIIAEVKKLIGKKPIFGICLGHQILALANGADTFKMKFGHRGVNHPVKDLLENKVLISSQNHGYAVDEKSLADINVEITNISLNDGTIEGLRYLDHPSFAVQYHPEASPGPGGHEYLFKRFVKLMGGQN